MLGLSMKAAALDSKPTPGCTTGGEPSGTSCTTCTVFTPAGTPAGSVKESMRSPIVEGVTRRPATTTCVVAAPRFEPASVIVAPGAATCGDTCSIVGVRNGATTMLALRTGGATFAGRALSMRTTEASYAADRRYCVW